MTTTATNEGKSKVRKSNSMKTENGNNVSRTPKPKTANKTARTYNRKNTTSSSSSVKKADKPTEPKLSRADKDKLIEEITTLREQYKSKYGHSIFSLPMPDILIVKLSYTQLRDILIQIVNTGETLYDGYYRYILKSKPTLDLY